MFFFFGQTWHFPGQIVDNPSLDQFEDDEAEGILDPKAINFEQTF
jgi:hypothetical protein